MPEQVKLTNENFYPKVEEVEGEEDEADYKIKFDPDQVVVCGLCGGVMKNMAPGGSFESLVNKDILYSCRNPLCSGDADRTSGGSTLRVLITDEGDVIDRQSIGAPSVRPQSDIVNLPDVGVVHDDFFDAARWEEPDEN